MDFGVFDWGAHIKPGEFFAGSEALMNCEGSEDFHK